VVVLCACVKVTPSPLSVSVFVVVLCAFVKVSPSPLLPSACGDEVAPADEDIESRPLAPPPV